MGLFKLIITHTIIKNSEDDIEEKYKQLDRIALDAAYLEWKITTMASYVSSHEYVTKGFNGIEDIKPGFAQFIW